MGIKCLILLLPSSLVTYRTQVRVVDYFFGLLLNKNRNILHCCILAVLFSSSYWVCLWIQGRWLMLTEELGQVHQAMAPVSLWFHYLVTYQETDGMPGLTLGVLLALLYLILKVCSVYNSHRYKRFVLRREDQHLVKNFLSPTID